MRTILITLMKPYRKFRSLFFKEQFDAEMADEIRHHVELQTELNLKAGMNPEEARFAALRQFGNMTAIQEQAREVKSWVWLEQFMQDLRYACRQLRRNPGFTAAAVAVLGLGIGANAAVFNFVHTLLLAPFTYARPAEIMRISSQDKRNPRDVRDFSYPAYREILEGNTIFSDALASALLEVGVGEKGDTRRAAAAVVSANYFSVLGVRPAQGRTFSPEEATPGRATPVALVSHSYWKKHHFDPALLGSTLHINTRPFTIIGIMPEGFAGTTALFYTEVWLPLGVYDQVANEATAENGRALTDRTSTALMILGRLKPGSKAADAGSGLQALTATLVAVFPVEQKDRQLTVAPPSRFASNSNDTAVAWVGALLLGMAAIVLLVACLNLANMLLARGTARRKEIALRLALGGGRARIIRQLLTEGFLLALIGGVAGLLLALWSSGLLAASLGRMIPIDLVWNAGPQPALFAVTFVLCVLGTLVFALGPALKLSRSEVMVHLKEHAGEDIVRRRWKFLPRNPLVSAQLALSLALLTCAALFIRSATRAGAGAMETGLKTDGVFLMEVDASLGGHSQKQAQELYRRLTERFGALPGVESADLSTDVPLSGLDFEKRVRRVGGAAGAKSAKWNGVGENYFKSVGLPLLRGRAFTFAEATQKEGPPVVIINEELAKELWPEGDAVGQRLQLENVESTPGASVQNGAVDSAAAKSDETYEVVGMVPATRHNLFESAPDGGIYLPLARGFKSHVFFQLKFASLPPESEAATADLLRRVVGEVDATLPILSLRSFARHLDGNIQIWIVRAGAALFSVFGGLALCLAVVGAYGVIAYSVARRTREIGIRMALGAHPATVQRMILREGAVMLGSGLLIGVVLSLGTGKIVSSLLYRVNALDPVAFTVAPGVLAVAAFFACWIPARRATKVDPMVALRSE